MNLPIDLNEVPSWLGHDGQETDVVVSSRVRLARNLENHPFPPHAQDEELEGSRDQIQDALESMECTATWHRFLIKDLNDLEKKYLSERRLASDDLTAQPLGALVFNRSESRGVMVNEEDHLRIQALQGGLDLEDVYQGALEIEQDLAQRVPLAHSERWGYLTACPTNVGSGMRASVLLHVPGLVLTERIDRVLKAVSNLGLTIRGFYGEGSESQGFYLQLSNQVTLGQSTEELLASLRRVTDRLVQQERESRHQLLSGSGSQADVEDRIWRSFGTLRYARLLDEQQALRLLSFCRLGVALDVLEDLSIADLDPLMIRIQPAHLDLDVGERLAAEDRDQYRATVVRKALERGLHGNQSPSARDDATSP